MSAIAKAKLAIIHTTPVTVDSMKQLAAELIPGCELVNLVDDSILPELARNGGRLETVEPRWMAYAEIAAEQLGADCILSACSSVGEIAERAAARLSVPVLRIDEAMAEEAVRMGKRIGVAATLSTTLQPTMRLLQGKAERAQQAVELVPVLAEEAYRLLMSGDREEHDRVLAEALLKLTESADVVVLAQASMARVVSVLPVELQPKFLTSPRSGMIRVRQVLEGRWA